MADRALDISLEAGSPDLPACMLIHGVGMNKHMWADPDKARIMGGLFPMRVMLGGHEADRTLYHDLRDEGFTVLTWSQTRPVGPASVAVNELRRVLKVLSALPHRGLILIGHSRGGLIARAALSAEGILAEGETLLGLITLSSPHGGSELSRWAEYAGKLTSLVSDRIEDPVDKRSMAGTIKSMMDFVESTGVKELLPGSEFLRSLPASAPEGVYSLSIGGTDPSLISLPGIFSFPSSLETVFPSSLFPQEMTDGKGDGLVTARSARLPGVQEHLDYHVNHASVAVDRDVRETVVSRIKEHIVD